LRPDLGGRQRRHRSHSATSVGSSE
jgi:hypothetical protein